MSQPQSFQTLPIEIGLNAAIVSVAAQVPSILVVRKTRQHGECLDSLPFGPFDPIAHRTLDVGLRAWVTEQTGLRLGHVEQLYTFGDRGRHATPDDTGTHVVSIGYLALTRSAEITRDPHADVQAMEGDADWRSWYDFFPWEDWRDGQPDVLEAVIYPALRHWAAEETGTTAPQPGFSRLSRLQLAFGLDGFPFDEERVLERYELLYTAGLVPEAIADGRQQLLLDGQKVLVPGVAMQHDHRRILATAISRLRGKLKYRPVVFEMMPKTFTLTHLQQTVEALAGQHLHKQNFRRLVENGGLVEATGATSTETGGRPAKLYQFRRDVILERPAPGVRFGAR